MPKGDAIFSRSYRLAFNINRAGKSRDKKQKYILQQAMGESRNLIVQIRIPGNYGQPQQEKER
jgi:hypothetical protein